MEKATEGEFPKFKVSMTLKNAEDAVKAHEALMQLNLDFELRTFERIDRK